MARYLLSGDIEANPVPKTQHTAKSRFKSDASTAHSDPKQLATKYHVSIQTVRRWLRDLPLRFTSRNPFFDNPEMLNEPMIHYVKSMMYILELLRDGNKTRFTYM